MYFTEQDMMIICEDELQKLQKLEQSSSGDTGEQQCNSFYLWDYHTSSKGSSSGAGRRQVINPSVSTDVSSIFKGKTVCLYYGFH